MNIDKLHWSDTEILPLGKVSFVSRYEKFEILDSLKKFIVYTYY